MRTRLTRNLQIGFGISISILVVSAIASYGSIENLLKSSALVDHSDEVIQKLEATVSTMKDAETGQRGYLLTGYTEFLEPYNGSRNKAIQYANEFLKLTKDNAHQQVWGARIKEILLYRLNILQKLIDKKKSGATVNPGDLLAGKLAMDSLRNVVNHAELEEKNLLNNRLSVLNRYTYDTPFFLFIAALVAVAISVFSYFRVINEVKERARLFDELKDQEQQTAALNEELTATNEELASANDELAAANEEINATNEELAAANEELAAANEEINATNEDLAATNEELNAANEQLNESQEDIRQLNEKLGASNEELSATVDELYQSQLSLKALNDDLEDRVEARTRALTESEGRFRIMMETMPQIAWVSNNDGEINFFNKRWYTYTGMSYDDSKGWGWSAGIHPDDLPFAAEKYKEILLSGESGEFETRKRRKDGEYRWHLARLQPVKNESGEVQLWVGTATDIHELKNLQQQKDDFISIASHELKTPITSLKASLQLLDRLKDTPSTLTIPKLITQANKSLDRLNVLVEDLLNVSRLNQGQIHLHKTRFNLMELVNDTCQYIRIENVYEVTVTGETGLHAFADAKRVEQVLVNFLNNAIKYAPSSKEIKISVEKKDGMAKVSVTDQGPGIPSDKVPHLFDRYFRVDSAGMQFSGLGLGLYISAEIIKKHDGQIGVDSEEGRGSTFWFTIPLKARG
ncbi:ATP-binding protein [Mucilaginibacter ginsenosidivorans]|uniref:histidine kinase n=1 Tax=Mucilaginibacter ginsenosidivorans TaxID=398053 RepID=A0A5B8V2C0_9SPHI|nr:ATP-binding protein [Mucilaginibacter ginsenosidivorans]QEC64686.1 PAS domain S-box protein [Mucilaginibacter ginsenosidivorans]